MARLLLLLLLALATLVEAALAAGAFFAPAFTLRQFQVPYSADTAFLGYALAWTLLFVTLVAALAFWQVWRRRPHFYVLCYLLGLWWMGIGVGIYVAFGRPANLGLDTVKGLLIVLATWRCQAQRLLARRY